MTPDSVEVRLSRQEADYLVSAAFLKAAQIRRVCDGAVVGQSGVNLTLSRDLAEQLREELTEQLARVGFDEEYALTPEGQLLEVLIDRFQAD